MDIVKGRGVLEEVRNIERALYVIGPYTERFLGNGRKVYGSTRIEDLDRIKERAGVVVGVGGGKNLDSAKYLSKRLKVPYILVPTIPSSDGIASPSISLFQNGTRVSLFGNPPEKVYVDLDILESSPIIYKVAGMGDILSKYSSLFDWKLAEEKGYDKIHKTSYRMEKKALKIITNRPHNTEKLLEALILSGKAMALAGSSRPASGSEHLLSHAIDIIRHRMGLKPNIHGIQVAIMSVFTSYLQGNDWEAIKSFLEDHGVLPSLKTLGMDVKMFLKALRMAPYLRERYTILNEYMPSKHETEKILREVGLA